MLPYYFKLAVRSLWSQKLFTFINLLGLTVSMAASILIFIWVQNELSFDSFHEDPDSIYRVVQHLDFGDEIWHFDQVPMPLTYGIKSELMGVKSLAKANIGKEPTLELEDGNLFQEPYLAYVDSGWFDIFRYQVILGDKASFYRNPFSIAITEGLSKKLFSEGDPLGKMIRLDTVEFRVAMVLANNPTNSIFQFKVFIPLQGYLADPEQLENELNWENSNYSTFVKISPTIEPDVLGKNITDLFVQRTGDSSSSFTLEPLQEVRFNELVESNAYASQNKAWTYILGIIGLLLLLAAGLNYINLSTALLNNRVKEIGLKKVMGASFQNIFWQVILESLLVSFAAFFFAILLAKICLPTFNNLTGIRFELSLSNPTLYGIFSGIILFSIFLSGFYPALLYARNNPIRIFEKNVGQKGISLRKILVITQFSLAIVLLVSTFILFQQISYIQSKDVGYDRSYVVSISPDLWRGDWEQNERNFPVLEEELRSLAEFEAVASSNGSLVNIESANGGLSWEGMDPDMDVLMVTLSADEYLMDLFEFDMVKGRWFDANKSLDIHNIILNETAIKTFNIPEPVEGRKIKWRNKEGQIIGVVKDFHFSSLHKPIQPLLIFNTQGWSTMVMGRAKKSNIQEALAKSETIFNRLFPGQVFTYSFLDDTYTQMHRVELKMGTILKIFSGLIIFVACIGLFGLATYSVKRRTQEIGIRKVLGASSRSLVGLISKDFLKLVGLSILLASPIAWYIMDRWLESFAYQIEIHFWIFVLIGMLVLCLAFLTVSIHSFQVAIANPSDTLREE
ncbi:MAG: ABC transporter permease [Bacteroidota bacterium]